MEKENTEPGASSEQEKVMASEKNQDIVRAAPVENNASGTAKKTSKKTSPKKSQVKLRVKVSKKENEPSAESFSAICKQAKKYFQQQWLSLQLKVKKYLPIIIQQVQQGIKKIHKDLVLFFHKVRSWTKKYEGQFEWEVFRSRLNDLVQKIKSEIKIHLYLYRLNRRIEINKKKLVSIYVHLGQACFQAMEKKEIHSPSLELLQQQIQSLHQDIEEKNLLLKKILQRNR
jgi:hypothetical protein